MRTKAEILALVEEEDVEFIRLQFTDMFGNLKNVAVTAGQLKHVLEKKYAFDGSTLFGTFDNDGEDLYLYPDYDTFVILPWRPQAGKVARLLCDVCREDGSRIEVSPRAILKRVIQSAKDKGYTFMVDPECEFFLFHTDENSIPSTLTHEQAGLMDVGPIDLGENPRRDMIFTLEEMGFDIESSHHENAPGQQEIDFREGEAMQIADSVVTFKSAVRSIAKRFGLHATFMPKPRAGVAGSGMHLNFSVYKDGECLFNPAETCVAGGMGSEAYTVSECGAAGQTAAVSEAVMARKVSPAAKWFIGGILEHARAMCAVTNPLVNSYKRILSGFDAPKDLIWSWKNGNSLVKVRNRKGEDTKIEIRFPDPSADPYLAIALCIAAGIDGMERQLDPGAPVLDFGVNTNADSLPENLREAVCCMRQDAFVESVLGKEFTEIYADAKLQEWNDYMLRVSDWELEQYLNRI